MTRTQRMSLWLREVGGAYCDDCIAKEMKLSRRQANRTSSLLSGLCNFNRKKGVCSLCGAQRKVIEAV